MRIIKIIVCILFAAAVGVGAGYYVYMEKNTDNTYPALTSDAEVLEVPVNAKKADLLKGLAAYDEKDGDLTPYIMVSNISKFVEKGISNVDYVVFDKDSHATELTRKVKYQDYESPKFSLTQELKFPIGKNLSILSYIGASDMIDGDLTNNIRLLSSNLTPTTDGIYDVTLQVTNSHGDTSMITLKVEIQNEDAYAPKIELNKYITYCETGQEFDPKAYLKEVKSADGKDMKQDAIKIKSDIDKDKEGVYYVTYSMKDEKTQATGTAKLAVVVRDK